MYARLYICQPILLWRRLTTATVWTPLPWWRSGRRRSVLTLLFFVGWLVWLFAVLGGWLLDSRRTAGRWVSLSLYPSCRARSDGGCGRCEEAIPDVAIQKS